jgi:hypothetical protein
MAVDYLYTTYNARFSGSDELEDQLSRIEAIQAQSLEQICQIGNPVGADTQHDLAAILALQTLRHPDVLAWGRRRALRFAELALRIKRSMGLDEFLALVAPSLDEEDPTSLYQEIKSRTEAELEAELADIKALSPQDPGLAETDTLSAIMNVSASLRQFNMRVLDIPDQAGSFVLSDTPIPQDQLAKGFTVPLSRRVAIAASQAPRGERARLERVFADAEEIAFVNQAQWNRHARLIVGESREALLALPPRNWPDAT